MYAGANWHERECHEMFGIGFEGHPDLRNMYLPVDFEGHPLRKDFPLLARMVKPWPGIADVEPLPGDDNHGMLVHRVADRLPGCRSNLAAEVDPGQLGGEQRMQPPDGRQGSHWGSLHGMFENCSAGAPVGALLES